jgi:hypothetical protein
MKRLLQVSTLALIVLGLTAATHRERIVQCCGLPQSEESMRISFLRIKNLGVVGMLKLFNAFPASLR